MDEAAVWVKEKYAGELQNNLATCLTDLAGSEGQLWTYRHELMVWEVWGWTKEDVEEVLLITVHALHIERKIRVEITRI